MTYDPNKPIPEAIAFRRLVLHKIKLRSHQAISPYVLRNADAQMIMDHVARQMVAQLDSHVLAESKTQTHTIVEQPVYPSWKHHLLASLPETSFRRRFLERFWDLEDEPLAKRITHQVTANAHRAFPENTQQYPKDLGCPVEFAVIDDFPRYEDE